jgi:hypothetical protein
VPHNSPSAQRTSRWCRVKTVAWHTGGARCANKKGAASNLARLQGLLPALQLVQYT